LGQLSPGFLADLVVVNRFPVDDTKSSYKDIEILKTMIDGKWVWEA
jgi:predicted amidohydrolase YtcJ